MISNDDMTLDEFTEMLTDVWESAGIPYSHAELMDVGYIIISLRNGQRFRVKISTLEEHTS